jgi:hypothetical protein
VRVIWALQGGFSFNLLRGSLERRLSRPVLRSFRQLGWKRITPVK